MFQVLEPATMAGVQLRNRFMRSATWDAMAEPDGGVTDASVKLYEDLAIGGVGLIVAGYAFVSAHGKATRGQFGIHTDEMKPGLRRLVDVAHRNGAKIAAQIVHSGINSAYLANEGKMRLAPSEIPGHQLHRALTDGEIEGIIDDFAAAAVRARDVGFDAVQLHGAHGYLMSQFFSPIMNRREDRWGGSAENRRRFHVVTVRRVRAAIGSDFPLFIKFGVMDDDEGGAPLEEGIAALRTMREAGLDAVEISGGIGTGLKSASRVLLPEVKEDTYFRERAGIAKRALDIPVAVVGCIRRLETAEEIVSAGDADFISMSRPFIREPGLIRRWASGDVRPALCISCGKCMAICRCGEPLECGEERRLREERES